MDGGEDRHLRGDATAGDLQEGKEGESLGPVFHGHLAARTLSDLGSQDGLLHRGPNQTASSPTTLWPIIRRSALRAIVRGVGTKSNARSDGKTYTQKKNGSSRIEDPLGWLWKLAAFVFRNYHTHLLEIASDGCDGLRSGLRIQFHSADEVCDAIIRPVCLSQKNFAHHSNSVSSPIFRRPIIRRLSSKKDEGERLDVPCDEQNGRGRSK